MSWRKYSVLLSVFIAIAMITPPGITMVANNSNNETPLSGPGTVKQIDIPDLGPVQPLFPSPTPPAGTVAPNADVIFSEDFSTDPSARWTIVNGTGLGNWSWDSANGEMDYIASPGPYYTEDDYMETTFDITVPSTCIDTVILQMTVTGGRDTMDVIINGNTHTVSTNAGSVDIDITADVVTGTNTLRLYVSYITADFTIDDIVISMNYTLDISVDEIVGLYDGARINTSVTAINQIQVNVTNRGSTDATNVDFHLQIYAERVQELYDYLCWDMESCFLNTWDTVSWDGDQATWYWTTVRSHSPDHSYACKPDYLETYEAYSHDSLISHDWITIPDTITIDGIIYTVHEAYLTFWHWCKGEYSGEEGYGTPVDYGVVYIDDATGSTAVTGAIYDTSNKWEWWDPYYSTDPRDTDGRDPIDLSGWIGDSIKLNFTWFSDGYINNEGWYIDDVCIVLAISSGQPLIFQGYQFADIPAGETVTVTFPLQFYPEPYSTYYIQVYTTLDDCVLDNNELNWTIYVGDHCDAAITDLTVQDYYETDLANVCGGGMIDQVVPIRVEVYNNGTLTEDIPVRVTVFHRITETLFEDDFEDGDISDWTGAYSSFDTTGPYFPEHITDYDANLGNYALAYFTEGPNTDRYYLNGMNQGVFSPDIDLPPSYAEHTWFDFAAKWNMELDPFGFYTIGVWNYPYPIYYTGYYWGWDAWAPGLEDPFANAFLFAYPTGALGYTIFNNNTYPYDHPIFMDGLNNPAYYNAYHNGMNLFHIDITDWIEHYQELGYLTNKMSVGWLMSTGSSGNYNPSEPDWSGLMIDDVAVYYDYAGAKVWEETRTIRLAPGESGVLWFNWTATDFCDYIIKATIMLDCDEDPDNNEMTANTRLVTRLYEDDYESVSYDDNTYGLPDNWHVVEECSVCPDNHFWWNGVESYDGYESNTDDSLFINETFDFTGYTGGDVYLNFSLAGSMEDYFDYLLVEVSNDSWIDDEGVIHSNSWYLLDLYTGEYDWTTISIPIGATIQLYYGIAPTDFFTDTMMIRFRMVSDSGWEYKGPYIDNVEVNGYNGTAWTMLFEDDMEGKYVNGVFVEDWSEKYGWIHMQTPIGVFWHIESTFGNGPTTSWFWNGDWRPWSNFIWVDYDPIFGINWPNDYSYYQTYRDDVNEKLILEYDLTQAYEAIMTFAYNYSFDNGAYGYVEISTDGGETWNLIKIYGGTYGDGLNTNNEWRTRTIDLTPYAGGDVPILLRFHFVDDSDHVVDYGWLIDNITIIGKIDCIAPTVEATLDPAEPDGCNDWYVSPVKVTITASDNVGIKAIYYSVDGGAYQLYTAPFTVSGDGEHTVTFYAEDYVGNTSPEGTVTFKIDATAPTVTITYPEAGYIYLFGRQLFKNPLGGTLIIGGMTFQASASDTTSGVDYVHFEIDGMAYDDATSPYEFWWHKFDLIPKSYTLTAVPYDEACNAGTQASLSFTHWL